MNKLDLPGVAFFIMITVISWRVIGCMERSYDNVHEMRMRVIEMYGVEEFEEARKNDIHQETE